MMRSTAKDVGFIVEEGVHESWVYITTADMI